MLNMYSYYVQVFPSISSIEGNNVKFENGETHRFDAIVFATGYKSTVKNWLRVKA